jgi:hypothetical protein
VLTTTLDRIVDAQHPRCPWQAFAIVSQAGGNGPRSTTRHASPVPAPTAKHRDRCCTGRECLSACRPYPSELAQTTILWEKAWGPQFWLQDAIGTGSKLPELLHRWSRPARRRHSCHTAGFSGVLVGRRSSWSASMHARSLVYHIGTIGQESRRQGTIGHAHRAPMKLERNHCLAMTRSVAGIWREHVCV